MKYRLLYDAGNGYEDLDLGDEAPAMTYQIANLNELKSRQAAYSQAIKLPKTAKNMRILGFLDSFAVVADAAYTPRPCRLLCEGAQISPPGAVLYVDSIDEAPAGSVECQVVSGTVDLFSLLGDVDNEQMGSSAWKGVWTSQQIAKDNADRNSARLWPAVATLQGRSDAPFPGKYVEVYHLVPCYRFTTMIEELFRMYGYRVESDIFDDPYMKSLYITASKITADSDVTTSFGSDLANVVPAPGYASSTYSSLVLSSRSQVETLGGSKDVPNENPNLPAWHQWQYYAAQPGDYKLEITIHNSGSQPLDGSRKVRVLAHATRGRDYYTPGTTQDITEKTTSSSNSVAPGSDWNLDVEVPGLSTGDYIGFEILIAGGSAPITTVEATAKVSLIHDEAAPGIGSPFDFAQATGFKTYREMVQTFMQLFGVLVDVVPTSGASSDGTIGTVRMYTFQELYRRRDAGQYLDWSRKLVLNEERNIGFALANYAQNNIIQLTDNTDDGTHDAGSFAVRNRTLASEKTLFTIAVEAGRNLTSDGYTMAVVPTLDPMIETDEDGTTTMTPTYKGCKVHLVGINGLWPSLRIYTGFHEGTPELTAFPAAVRVPMQSLVDRYYKPIKLLMSNARTINAYFNLTALDIAHLDLLAPVWIKSYGCFFYISKIENFVAGQPTKVELVKMTSQEEQPVYYLFLNGRNQDVTMTAPAAATTLRIACRTNGTTVLTHSGDTIADATFGNGYIVVQTTANETEQYRVGTVSVSVEEDPTLVRKIVITQERKVVQYDVTLSLRTDGENLYVSTSRPLAATEKVVILTRGAGRMAWRNLTGTRTRDYHPSPLRWHIREYGGDTVGSAGKLSLPADDKYLPHRINYRWRLKTDKKGRKFVHITKANNSKGFGYKAVDGLDKAVTFAVVVVNGSRGYKRPEISNRCYFESRCHYRAGVLTQEFAVTKTP